MIINGNSLEELKKFPDNYFHSVVTDSPYGLSFMGKKWDYDVPSVELWQEVFRVLKEGGYLLSFAGTRTQHRMAVNIEDAGFEIRDMIAWVYGSGFPKSHNIGKAVDKLQGNEREEIEPTGRYKYSFDNSLKGKIYGEYEGNIYQTKGTSEWEGWGTALKPALEPITMARKPFKTSVAENVLKNGVGGINIDGCRVVLNENEPDNRSRNNKKMSANNDSWILANKEDKKIEVYNKQGRFPANFIHDGSDEVKDLFPETKSGTGAIRKNAKGMFGLGGDNKANIEYGDKGSASRFFYCAKASKQDREENNNHPTVKPTDLMRYLVRLVTPKNGIVLDCFMGSGSTGKACALEGFEFVGIDLDKDYCEIAKARIDKALEDKKQDEAQQELF
jgi:DNA modification methylase